MALVVGHRGSAQPFPSNTLPAFEHALSLGAEVVEADVRRSRDGMLVVAHDERLADGRRVGSLTAAQLDRALGGRIARVDDLLELVEGRGILQLDFKGRRLERPVAETVRRAGAHEWVVMTGGDAAVTRMKAEEPRIRCGLSIGRSWRAPAIRGRISELWPLPRVRASGADFVAVNWRLALAGVTRRCHSAGVGVWVWTVNDRRLLQLLLSDRRVDAVITDLPQAALAVRDGLRLPGPPT